MSLQRVDHMLETPVVGKFYLVPGVMHRFAMRDGWFPVIGPKHEDREHINFPDYHYHPDWRFMPEWAWDYATDIGEQYAYGRPLCHRGDNYEIMPFGELTFKARKCRRKPPTNTIFTTKKNGQSLHRAWAGRDARKGPYGWICPHRGTALGSVPLNGDGTITCPLHGLKFCAKTGKSVPTLPPVQVTP